MGFKPLIPVFKQSKPTHAPYPAINVINQFLDHSITELMFGHISSTVLILYSPLQSLLDKPVRHHMQPHCTIQRTQQGQLRIWVLKQMMRTTSRLTSGNIPVHGQGHQHSYLNTRVRALADFRLSFSGYQVPLRSHSLHCSDALISTCRFT
jgi:hypothetical protein